MASRSFLILATLFAASQVRAEEPKPTIHELLEKGEVEKAKALLAKDRTLAHSQDRVGQTPLHVAIDRGHFEIVEPLLKVGADVNALGRDGAPPLHLAKEVRIIKLLVKYKVDLEQKWHWKTAIERAASYSVGRKGKKDDVWLSVVKALREAGANYTLDAAISLGDLERTKEILGKKPEAEVLSDLLSEAAYNGHAEIVKHLLTLGASIEDASSRSWPVLFRAIEHPEVVRILLDSGADPNVSIEFKGGGSTGPGIPEGMTLLHGAAERGFTESARLLIAKGAKIDAEAGSSRSTPAQWAATNGHAETVKLLVKNGADLKGERGEVAMTYTAFRITRPNSEFRKGDNDRYVEVLRFLISQGVPINMNAAIALNEIDRVKQLLATNSELANLIDRGKRPILHRAIRLDRREIALLLLNAGARVEAEDEHGYTSLIQAAFWGHAEIASMLLNRKAKLDAKNSNGATALHEAARCSNPDVALLLIRAGAELNARDKDGRTPLREIEITVEQDKISHSGVRNKSRQTLAIIRRFGGER